MRNELKKLFDNIASSIRETLPNEDEMSPSSFPDKIRAVASAGGGSSSADVRYVTFMSEDGTTELYKKPVAVGDDCVDVVAKGLLPTPSKESDNYYNYEYSGWSLTSGGNADSSALSNVTEDRVVYASYTATARLYTVRFFDGDELHSTVYVTYGKTAECTINKVGYVLIGWEPSNEAITADTDCYAVWEEGSLLSKSTWSEINDACTSGEYANLYNVGDKKLIDITLTDKVVSANVVLIGIDHDDLSDGSGKAKLTFALEYPLDNKVTYRVSENNDSGKTWFDLRGYDGSWLTRLPSDLQAVIKSVNKITYNTSNSKKTVSAKVWPFSHSEVGVSVYSSNLNSVTVDSEGDLYELFGQDVMKASPDVTVTGATVTYGIESRSMNNVYSAQYAPYKYVLKNGVGKVGLVGAGDVGTYARGFNIRFGFCI